MIRPIHNMILIEPDPPVEKTAAGLILPQYEDDGFKSTDYATGMVKAIGPGLRSPDGIRLDPIVQRDKRVIFKAYRGQYIVTPDCKGFALVPEDQVMGYVE